MNIEKDNNNGDTHQKRKTVKFELKSDGTIERVGPFGSYGPVVSAGTKPEAIQKLLSFAYRALENTPKVKVKNGAYQLAYESLNYGINVESGRENEPMLCMSGIKDWDDLNETIASFDYYASEAYVNESLV